MTKTELQTLCQKLDKEKNEGMRALLRKTIGEFLGSLLNTQNVFVKCKNIEIIRHKNVNVSIEYIHTPFGYLAYFSYQIHIGNGATGPICIYQIIRDEFHPDIQVFARNEIAQLIPRLIGFNEKPIVINTLKRYLKQTEQAQLFDNCELQLLS